VKDPTIMISQLHFVSRMMISNSFCLEIKKT